MACPAAPLPRLSIAQIARTTRPSNVDTQISASFVPATAATLGAWPRESTRTNGLPAYARCVRCVHRVGVERFVEDRVRVDEHPARDRHDVRREGDARGNSARAQCALDLRLMAVSVEPVGANLAAHFGKQRFRHADCVRHP